MSQLGDALFTNTQQALLGLFFSRPDRSFYFKEILRLTGMGVATIKRELDSMRAAGIVTLTRSGNQHHYQANPDCPIYAELAGIVRKTFGVAGVIRQALAPLEEGITRAFVFGSVASGRETAGSDVDLMIVGDVRFAEVVKVLQPVQEALGREINPRIYTAHEWKRLQKDNDSFIREVLTKPQLDVIGGKDEPEQSRRENTGAY
ncbi:nucleotidyltransferase domain-containing protein [Thiohalophilus sp.]|uniref:nucleotidyltransferase domain-containing protein n=1 Tax=Thiohalophilus sp. TaxID=3028392 RepID=UPI002ACEBCEA|nr:nucleotidyltransferase domain-containing protein [Thiohalophilus sp.]MDZ7804955.1 nucleotidyltransferase domain-containing protein [Thiohalophilus sp.]